MENKRCFISFCSDDAELMERLFAFFRSAYGSAPSIENERFFCTYQSSLPAGTELNAQLKQALSSCEYMLAVITDSYLRSSTCIYEICSFHSSEKLVLPLVFNGQTGIRFLKGTFNTELLYINAADSTAPQFLVDSFRRQGVVSPRESQTILSARQFLREARQAPPTRPYIGCEPERYFGTIAELEKMGVCALNRSKHEEILRDFLSCSELYILSTTGAGLIRSLCGEVLPEILLRGGTITVLLPNPESDYCRDVAEIERPDGVQANQSRLNKEFQDAIFYLKEALLKAEALQGDSAESLGKIRFGCAFTLLRQTVILGMDGQSVLGWMSMTIPPKRTVTGTPTIEFRSANTPESLGYKLCEHLKSICALSQSRGAFYTLTDDFSLPDGFYLERASAKRYWKERFMQAKYHMLEQADGEGVLIEVAAQHPLRGGTVPGKEFSARLDAAAELYSRLRAKQTEVKIYVPGSVHRYQGEADRLSLSKAGCDYLLKKGVLEEDLFGEEINEKYKGEAGVYNSADECCCAARLFFDGEFQSLACVCSPNQMMRKKLFYLEMGVLPDFYTVPCKKMFHSDVEEIFEAIPNVLYVDHSQQGRDSKEAQRTRKERKPE